VLLLAALVYGSTARVKQIMSVSQKTIGSLCLILLLSSCGLTSLPFFGGGGGGPTVNSNAQVGKENKQAVVTYEEEQSNNAGRDVITTEILKEIETGTVEDFSITNTNIPVWVMLLLILGWLLPTPTQIGQGLYNLVSLPFRRKKDDV
jgi:hypothetical protein